MVLISNPGTGKIAIIEGVLALKILNGEYKTNDTITVDVDLKTGKLKI